MNWKNIAISVFGVSILVGCSATGLTQLGKDRWRISDTNATYRLGADVYKDILVEANKFCTTNGQQVDVLFSQKVDYQPPEFGWVIRFASPASATIVFTCK